MLQVNVLKRVAAVAICDVCGLVEKRVMDAFDERDVLFDDGWENQWRHIDGIAARGNELLVCGPECLAKRMAEIAERAFARSVISG
jgi:hypothetical protein